MSRRDPIRALAQLSGRERALLGILALVVVPLAVFFLLVQPMLEARGAAERQARENAALLDWVAQQVAQMPQGAGPGGSPAAAAPEPIGASALEQSLDRAGLRDHVTQLANRGEAGIDLALEKAPFAELGAWLNDVSGDWGYRIATFRIEAASPGHVNARFALEPAR